MKAVLFDAPGGEEVLRLGDAPAPVMAPGEIRIRVAATAVNRADLLQRRGLYPPPPGASPILGLECAGEVAETGDEVMTWRPGDRVMALLPGGGYAEEAVVDAGCAMAVPEEMALEDAAAVPEAFLTVHRNVFEIGRLERGGGAPAPALLVHGGGSGIGTSAIQLAREAGADVLATAGSDDKVRRCLGLGATAAVNYRTQDWVEAARAMTAGRGVDVVLDSIGAPYLQRNVAALAPGGRLVLIGTMGGSKGEMDLAPLLARGITVTGSTLRPQPPSVKRALVASFLRRFGAALADGRVRPVVDRVLPLAHAAEAHRLVAASAHFGKIVLRVRA